MRFIALLLLFYLLQVPEGLAQPLNFIIIYTDDQRAQTIGSNGNAQIITPALDAFSRRAVKFTNANVAFSLCSPSRAAMLTGRYGSANGVLHLGSGLNKGERSLAQYMKTAGYQTALSGKWHLKQHPRELGFDFHVFFESNGPYYNRKIEDLGKTLHPKQHCDEYCAGRSIDFLQEAVKQDNPFFLWHCTQLPHMNGRLIWNAKQATKEQYEVAEMPVPGNHLDDLSGKPAYLHTVRNRTKAKDYGYPDSSAVQEHTRDYYSVITEMDAALGRLFAELERLNLWKNTYVIFMSDNGWMLSDHGFTSKVLPYQPSSQVPLMITGPGIEPGSTEALASNLDLLPTVLDLAGLPIPGNIHGKSLQTVLMDKEAQVREIFVYEGLGNYGGALPNLTAITDRYRYIVTYTDSTLTEVEFIELYDQYEDRLEMNNLAGERRVKQVLRQLSRAIEEHKKQVLKQ